MDGVGMGERKGRRANTGQRKVGSVAQWRWTICELGSEAGANWPPLPVRSLAPAGYHPAAPPPLAVMESSWRKLRLAACRIV